MTPRHTQKGTYVQRYAALFLLAVALLATATCVADQRTATRETHQQSSFALFNKANELYRQNKYEEALALYEQLITQGIADPVLYYNTGNAYAQLHRTGPAVLMYERALQGDPRDADIHENLAQIAPAINRPHVFILLRPLYQLKEAFTLNEVTIVLDSFFILFTIAMVGVFLARKELWRRISKRIAHVAAVLFLLTACLFAVKIHETLGAKAAVVMQETSARSGPSTSFSDILKLPAGTKVRLVGHAQEGWARIRLQTGQSGYLPISAFEII
jgi:tetratricopeptide (TPR) repeat protein